MTQFLTYDSGIPTHIAFPCYLLDMNELSETTKIIYCILLNRSRLSQRNEGWSDNQGRVFIYYPIKDLAGTVHKSEMTVKAALSSLEKNGLIFRKRQGVGKANRIYVKLPIADSKPSARQPESCPPDGKKTVCLTERKLSGSNIEKSNNESAKRVRKAYGKYQNVLLSDVDIDSLKQTVPSYPDYIERLSQYMQSTAKQYADHAATIRSWYHRDNPPHPTRNYNSKEDESL